MRLQNAGQCETPRELNAFGVTDIAAQSGSNPASTGRRWFWPWFAAIFPAAVVLSPIVNLARFGARQIAPVSLWAAWMCPVCLIARLPIESGADCLLLWLAGGAVAGILAWAKNDEHSNLSGSVYLPVAVGLIAGLLFAARRF